MFKAVSRTGARRRRRAGRTRAAESHAAVPSARPARGRAAAARRHARTLNRGCPRRRRRRRPARMRRTIGPRADRAAVPGHGARDRRRRRPRCSAAPSTAGPTTVAPGASRGPRAREHRSDQARVRDPPWRCRWTSASRPVRASGGSGASQPEHRTVVRREVGLRRSDARAPRGDRVRDHVLARAVEPRDQVLLDVLEAASRATCSSARRSNT